MSTTISVNELLGQAQNFLNKDEQWTLVDGLLGLLKGSEPKAEKAKAQRKPRGPVSKDSFIYFSNQIVLPVLKFISEGDEFDAAERKQMMGVACKAGVSAILWAEIKAPENWAKLMKLSEEDRIEEMHAIGSGDVDRAYAAWKAKPKDSDSGSVKSKASKTSKAELSDEEKAAKKAAANEKRKATREANKAAKAAETEAKKLSESESEKPVEKPKKVVKPKVKVAGPEFSEEQVSWCDEKGREYLVLEYNMWDATTTKWVGKWDAKANKIDTTAKEPELEADNE